MPDFDTASPRARPAAGRRQTLFRLCLTALFAALVAAGAFIAVPLPFSPVPVVLQNLLALLSGLILGPVLGPLSVLLYLAAGALGAPVFAGGTGGIVRFMGPTGGFLYGYVLASLCAGLFAGSPRVDKTRGIPWRIIAGSVAGFLAVYVPGLIQLKLLSGRSWTEVFVMGFLPFLPGDALKCVIAVPAAGKLRRLVALQIER